MDSRVFEAAQLGDIQAIRDLLEENADVLDQVTSSNHSSILHVAARTGQADFVSEILKMRPQILTALNRKLDTALHEAAREGHAHVAKILLETDERHAYKANRDHETALFIACEGGHIDVVKQLLQINFLFAMESERPDERTSLHAAAARGHAEIVKELLKARPGLVRKADKQGTNPLHSAASHGHLDVTRELLSADCHIYSALDGCGRSALHIAAMKGGLNVLHEILSQRPESADVLTAMGETILHSAVETNQIEVVKHVVDILDTSVLINKQDNDGNTVLHLATRKKLNQIVRWLVSNTSVNLNVLNKQGLTALDILENEPAHSEAMIIRLGLKEAGAKCAYELQPVYCKSEELKRSVSSINHHVQAQLFQTAKTGDPVNGMPKELREFHKEGIKNASNTVTVIAVLIATVTFGAIFTVPGGLENDGKHKGAAIKADTVAFKVFLLCDTVALFSSLVIVLILVTVVPFHRKSLVKLVFYSNKMMWVAVGCTASAFMAAGYVVVAPKTKWITMSMCVVGGVTMAFMIFTLCCLVYDHQRKKTQLKRKKREKIALLPLSRRAGTKKSGDSFSLRAETKISGDSFSLRAETKISEDSCLTIEACGKGGFHPI